MNEKITIYHYTKRENLDAILTQGLIPGTKFLTLGSKLREDANYFWDSPMSDAMGYFEKFAVRMFRDIRPTAALHSCQYGLDFGGICEF